MANAAFHDVSFMLRRSLNEHCVNCNTYKDQQPLKAHGKQGLDVVLPGAAKLPVGKRSNGDGGPVLRPSAGERAGEGRLSGPARAGRTGRGRNPYCSSIKKRIS